MNRNRTTYALLSIGAIGEFFGHAMWAVDGKDAFVKLFTGTFDHLFGVTVATGTATDWVKGIGWFDVAVSVVLLAMLIGNIQGKGGLYAFAYSKAAYVVYAWGALWGFLTAGSRVTAAGQVMPEVWDVVERAPNFLLPAALLYMVYQYRQDHTGTAVTAGTAKLSSAATK